MAGREWVPLVGDFSNTDIAFVLNDDKGRLECYGFPKDNERTKSMMQLHMTTYLRPLKLFTSPKQGAIAAFDSQLIQLWQLAEKPTMQEEMPCEPMALIKAPEGNPFQDACFLWEDDKMVALATVSFNSEDLPSGNVAKRRAC